MKKTENTLKKGRCLLKRVPKIYPFKSLSESRHYAVTHSYVADKFTVATYKLYHQNDPDIPEVQIGQTITSTYVPYGYFKYKKKVWPVFSDGYSQQIYLYINNDFLGSGSYADDRGAVSLFLFYIDLYDSSTPAHHHPH